MPPCARAPTTSYCPATRSPGWSFGVKEKAWPHAGQKPSARPGRPSLLRPTGLPHLAQLRLSSGTSGFFRTTLDGSTRGIGGMVVRPAPSRADRSRWDDERTRWVTPLPTRWEPMAAESRRNDPVLDAEDVP